MSADAKLRWAVRTQGWDPGQREWSYLLALLPEEEQKEVTQFKFKDDQKRALLSRLLQRSCIHRVLDVPWDEVAIKRTKGKKPYAWCPDAPREFAPNFNYSVSHEGDYVVLAAEPLAICGIDVAAPQELRSKRRIATRDLFTSFAGQFTPAEWRVIRGAGPQESAMEDTFRRFWSLKEALVKARGDGLGFDFSAAAFEVADDGSARVFIRGKPQDRWAFHSQRLSGGHWVSVARGPPEDIVDAWGTFTSTLRSRSLSAEQMKAALQAHSPPFSLLQAEDVVPEDRRGAYEDACNADAS